MTLTRGPSLAVGAVLEAVGILVDTVLRVNFNDASFSIMRIIDAL